VIIYLDYEESFLVLQNFIPYNRFFIKYTVKVLEASDYSLGSKWLLPYKILPFFVFGIKKKMLFSTSLGNFCRILFLF